MEPHLRRGFAKRVGERAEALAAVLPGLTDALGVSVSDSLGPESHGEARTLPALEALVRAISPSDRPALMLLDDCQWADAMTLRLLARLSETTLQNRHILVVAAFRAEEVGPQHPLRSMSQVKHITLSNLGEAELRLLVESMAGPVPEDGVQTVLQLAQGNPFMATAILQGLVESGALFADVAGWRTDADKLADARSSRRAGALLAKRLQMLPDTPRELLAIGAILGKAFEVETVSALTRHSPAQTISALDEARRRHLIWADSSGTRCTFVHDRIREQLLEGLSTKRRRALHAAAGEYVLATTPEQVFDLAYHFDAAGDSLRALHYALEAGDQARKRNALEIAEHQYRIAERAAENMPREIKQRTCESLGEVQMLRGNYDEAQKYLEVARDLCHGNVAQAQIQGKLGELEFKRVVSERVQKHAREDYACWGNGFPAPTSPSCPR